MVLNSVSVSVTIDVWPWIWRYHKWVSIHFIYSVFRPDDQKSNPVPGDSVLSSDQKPGSEKCESKDKKGGK